jgi:2OG-Fe(II) oxygenase superfamily
VSGRSVSRKSIDPSKRVVYGEAVIDQKALEPWIQAQHLDADAITAYADALDRDPARMLLIRDVLVPERARTLATFLAEDAAYQPEFGLYSAEEGVSEETWLEADESDRFFRFHKLAGPKPGREMSRGMITYLSFRSALQSEPFKQYFEEVARVPLTTAPNDIGVHGFEAGDFLRQHDDDNRDRRVALVLYLSPEWDARYGGSLRMVAKGGQVEEYPPEYNSLAVFDVTANEAHEVLQIQPEANERRRFTIGGWYHDTESHDGR